MAWRHARRIIGSLSLREHELENVFDSSVSVSMHMYIYIYIYTYIYLDHTHIDVSNCGKPFRLGAFCTAPMIGYGWV